MVVSRTKKTLILIGLCILCIEVLLRGLGFCDALLYQSSNQYEYIAQPNQDRDRFGAHIHYNSYSQRNEEPDSTKTIIFRLGRFCSFWRHLDGSRFFSHYFIQQRDWITNAEHLGRKLGPG